MNFKQKIANYIFKNIPLSDLPAIAKQGILEGYESESLSVLANLSQNNNAFEIENCLNKALAELKIDFSNPQDVARELLDYYLDEILYLRSSSVQCLKNIVGHVLDKFDIWDENVSEKDRLHFQNLYETHFELENLYSRENEPFSESAKKLIKSSEEIITNELKAYTNVFKIVELQPEYPNGQAELFKFLAANVRYPLSAREQGIYGEIHCGFVIDRDGYVTDVAIKKIILFQEIIVRKFFRNTRQSIEIKNNAEMEAEVIRVVSMMPQWKPGYQQGRPVRVSYRLPIKFRLE
jgi:hypothetical protein